MDEGAVITITWAEAFVGGVLLMLVEVSLALRFRPLKTKLTTIEHLLRNDLHDLYESVAAHEDRIVELEQRLEDHLGPKPTLGRSTT